MERRVAKGEEEEEEVVGGWEKGSSGKAPRVPGTPGEVGGWVGGWVGGNHSFMRTVQTYSSRPPTHPPTHTEPTAPHSNRLLLLYPPTHPPTLPTYRPLPYVQVEVGG